MKRIITIFTILIVSLFVFSPVAVFAASDKSCKTIDGAYYGKNGKETDKGTYEKECVPHSCELVADAYFGKDGKEVSQAQFESECEAKVVTSPDTASYIDIIFILIGISIISYSCIKISTVKE